MLGTIGQYIKRSDQGHPSARKVVKGIFGPDFQRGAGWQRFLDTSIPGGDVDTLLNRSPAWWDVRNFQALFVACWIFHPFEKGAYMLQLARPAQHANVRGAYDRLLAAGKLKPRISSHLSGRGASAADGWEFLNGYAELLVQVEGERAGAPYLYLKSEGHPMDGAISTLKHVLSWCVKALTDQGMTASAELKNLAAASTTIEARAAENFQGPYKNLLKQLKLKGTTVTVAEVVEKLYLKTGATTPIPDAIKSNTHLLGKAMLGSTGFIELFRRQQEVLKKHGIKFTPEMADELRRLADRMVATAVTHPRQHYHEIRVTPLELTQGLTVFRSYV